MCREGSDERKIFTYLLAPCFCPPASYVCYVVLPAAAAILPPHLTHSNTASLPKVSLCKPPTALHHTCVVAEAVLRATSASLLLASSDPHGSTMHLLNRHLANPRPHPCP